MFIGHLPAGYLIGRMLSDKSSTDADVPAASSTAGRTSGAVRTSRAIKICAVMAGAVFPDFDMIYFYLFDHQSAHHHLYWTHIPAFWLLVCFGILFAATISKYLRPPVIPFLFLAGVVSHLLLDSIVGDIYWLVPLSYEAFSLFTIYPRYTPWYWNFVLNWVFGLELLLLSAALILGVRDKRAIRAKPRLRAQ